jgi:hypothetical protein
MITLTTCRRDSCCPERLARHRAFWSLEPADRPLLGAFTGGYTYPIIYDVAGEGDFLTPAHFGRPAAFFDYLERELCDTARVETDCYVPISVLYGVPWMEACLGLPVQVQAGLFWPHALLAEDEPLERLTLTLRQDWLDALCGFMAGVVAQFGESHPIAPPFLRGPADLLTAVMGTARACLEWHDQPEAMLRLAGTCADAWRSVATAVSRLIPPFCGGYVNNARYLWSPARCAYTSEDSTTFLSPATFRRCLLPADLRIAESFPYGFMHRHSVSQHNIPDLLGLPAGWAIEVTLDPTGPSIEELLPLFRRLQGARRPLILFGVRDAGELRALTESLSPSGLCLILQTDTPAQAEAILREVNRA